MNWRWGLLGLLALAVILGPLAAPQDPARTNPDFALQPPSQTHPLGTDALGRDVLSRLLVGGQRTLLQSMAACTLASILGIAAGLLIAVLPPLAAAPLRAVMVALLAAPQLVWALAILALAGRGAGPLILALGLPLAAPMATVAHAAFHQALRMPYMDSARVIGAGWARVARAYLLPNTSDTLTHYAAVLFAYAVLNGAVLAFLGFSAPGEPEWGVILAEARLTFRAAPWAALASGTAITLLVMAALSLARSAPRVRR